jgi:predicted nucleotidyltransferase
MTINDLSKNGLLLLDCVSGSRAYGLHTPESDTDLKGVFLLPRRTFYGLIYTEQVNNETNDLVYYELKRFVQLLTNSNPNILELLASPEDCIRYRHPIMGLLKPEFFLSKLCKQSFAGYAQTQIKKARGLNKKVLNPH